MHVIINSVHDFYKSDSDMGCAVFQVVLEDEGQMRVVLLSYGATIYRMFVPNRSGILENVVLGYEHHCDYRKNPLYAGAVLGPIAGRIKGAQLPVGSHICHLSANDGHHNLHGGFDCASFQNWAVESHEESSDSCSVTFTLMLPDGLDGFPGNRTLSACYTLKQNHCLELSYGAVSDRDTYFNLSNHSYFNLSGDFTRSGLVQELIMCARWYIANDSEHIPTGIYSCAGTPFDFIVPASIQLQMQAYPEDAQLAGAHGYNHAFLLEDSGSSIKKALSLKDSASGRHLTLYTDAPSVVLYSGGYLVDSHLLAGGVPSSPSCAIALEAQDIPDAPHITPEQYHITAAGEPFQRTIIYAF